MDSVDDDFIDILDDTEDTLGVAAQLPWRLLVVDDDEEVHAATRFALQGIRILGRELMLVHTHSSAQTRELLKEAKAAEERGKKEDAERNCSQARSQLRALQDGQRMQRTDPDTGERTVLGDDDRAADIARQQSLVEQWCK